MANIEIHSAPFVAVSTNHHYSQRSIAIAFQFPARQHGRSLGVPLWLLLPLLSHCKMMHYIKLLIWSQRSASGRWRTQSDGRDLDLSSIAIVDRSMSPDLFSHSGITVINVVDFIYGIASASSTYLRRVRTFKVLAWALLLFLAVRISL